MRKVAISLAYLVSISACSSDECLLAEKECTYELPYELSCPIGETECQQAIFTSLAELMNESDELPPIRTITPEQFEEELWASVEESGGLEVETPATRALRSIGFVRLEATSITEEHIHRRVNNTAAYWSRADKAITIIDREYAGTVPYFILAHELVHAIQDRTNILDTVFAEIHSQDHSLALRSITEGDAQHWASLWMTEVGGVPPFHGQWKGAADDGILNPEISLINASSFFPYGYGFQFVTDAYHRKGATGREELITEPPTTSRSIWWGYDAYRELNLDASTTIPEVAHTAPPLGWKESDTTSYGAWHLAGFLGRLELSSESQYAASSWIGDRLSVYEHAESGEVAAVWRIRLEAWDESSDDDPNATVARIVNESLGPYAWAAVPGDGEVTIIATDSSDTLSHWLGDSAREPRPTLDSRLRTHTLGQSPFGHLVD